MSSPPLVGTIIGLVIGVVLVSVGVWQAVVVGVIALGGWLVGKYVAGEIPIIDALLERFISSRRGDR
jgi:uncharacterized membrane protein